MTDQIKIDSNKLKTLICERHLIAEQWICLIELNSGTGWQLSTNYLDVFAMHCWPSKNHLRIAYEVKVSRNDFRNELKRPGKREFGLSISNEFYFVAPKGIIPPNEVPENCGLLEPTSKGNKLRIVVRARQREAKEFTVNQVASMLRSAQNSESQLQRKIDTSIWKFEGQELTEKEINSILQMRWDNDFRDFQIKEEIRKKVNQEIAENQQETKKAGLQLCDFFNESDIEPPDFVKELAQRGYANKKDSWATHYLTAWIKKYFVTGVSFEQLNIAKNALKSAENQLKLATESYQKISLFGGVGTKK